LFWHGAYEFKYSGDVKDALKHGFSLLTTFPDVGKTYVSEKLFPEFSSRLPDPRRRDISSILKKYGLNKYDHFELLKQSQARLPIDMLSFIDPIFPSDQEVNKNFFLAGTRHYINCEEGANCGMGISVPDGASLTLELEPDNEKDPNAVIVKWDGTIVGYIPRYYAPYIAERLRESSRYVCQVVHQDQNGTCDECIRISLTM